jgi:hypothetical protein
MLVSHLVSDLALDGKVNRILPISEPVSIRRVIRPMRGGSQSQLVQCDDGHFYVAKFLGNPQGNRTLVNELVTHRLVMDLGVSTPNVRLLNLPQSVQQEANVFFLMGNRRVSPLEGLHLGSQCPANPDKTAIFDFLPARLLSNIGNLSDFAAMFVLDKWLNQTDKRQAIFIRDRKVKATLGFQAYFIDHGLTFGGRQWRFDDAPLHGLAFPPNIYSKLDMRRLTSAAVDRVQAISPATLHAAIEGVPPAWFDPGDRESFTILLTGLEKRQRNLPLLVGRHLDALNL